MIAKIGLDKTDRDAPDLGIRVAQGMLDHPQPTTIPT
jgi:hypothetical protein